MFFTVKKEKSYFVVLMTFLIISCMCFGVHAMKPASGEMNSRDLLSIECKVCDAIFSATAKPSTENYMLVATIANEAAMSFAELADLANSMKYRVISAKANVSAHPEDEDAKEHSVAVLIEAAEFWQSKDEVLSEIYLSQVEEGLLSLEDD